MGQQCLTCNGLPQRLSSVRNTPSFWKVKHCKIADNKHASPGNLWWTDLHDSHNTSQEYFILCIYWMYIYIFVYEAVIYFCQASIVVCIFYKWSILWFYAQGFGKINQIGLHSLFSSLTFVNWNAVHCINKEPRMV